MREDEEKLISAIERLKPDKLELDSNKLFDDFKNYFVFLQKQNFNCCTPEFMNHPALDKFYTRAKTENLSSDVRYGLLLLRIEDYLMNKNDNSKAQEKLEQIESALKLYLEDFTREKPQGINILPEALGNSKFIRKVYSLHDQQISCLFSKYLPIPRSTVFAYYSKVPEFIAQREQDSTESIQNILNRLKKENKQFSAFEKSVKKVQRNFRKQRRKREDVNRISANYQLGAQETKKLLLDANKPYIPKCEDRELAGKILMAAQEVKLFDTVRHFTAGSALQSIFNDGLYGRKTLLEFYMRFKPAALQKTDTIEGDGNVICFGANEIDPLSKRNGIELIFDLKKIMRDNNPCIFFKQKDLKFRLAKIRNIKIGEIELFFSHDDLVYEENVATRWNQRSTLGFQFFHENDISKPYAYTDIESSLLVSYNLKKMHKILVLNFFRYVDNLYDKNLKEDVDTKNKIYLALAKLDHQSLVKTLQEIGRQLTDTMEFNFYGAHQIDFSALLYINKYGAAKGYYHRSEELISSLDLPHLVNELKMGNTKALDKAVREWPEIFNSHRFISYLLDEIKHESVSIKLQERLNRCDVPSWDFSRENNCTAFKF